jgi:hypothetical protein
MIFPPSGCDLRRLLAVTTAVPADYTLNVSRSTPEYHPIDQVKEFPPQEHKRACVICHQVSADRHGQDDTDEKRNRVGHGWPDVLGPVWSRVGDGIDVSS